MKNLPYYKLVEHIETCIFFGDELANLIGNNVRSDDEYVIGMEVSILTGCCDYFGEEELLLTQILYN